MSRLPDYRTVPFRGGAGAVADPAAWTDRFRDETGRVPDECAWRTGEQIDVCPLYTAADTAAFQIGSRGIDRVVERLVQVDDPAAFVRGREAQRSDTLDDPDNRICQFVHLGCYRGRIVGVGDDRVELADTQLPGKGVDNVGFTREFELDQRLTQSLAGLALGRQRRLQIIL